MIVERRYLSISSLGAGTAYKHLLHTRFRFTLAERWGMTADIGSVFQDAPEKLHVRTGRRLQLLVPISGRIGVRTEKEKYWLLPGQFAIERQGTYEGGVRQEGAHSCSIVFTWEPAWLGLEGFEPTGPVPLPARAAVHIRAAADTLAGPVTAQHAAAALHPILEALRMEGIPFHALDPEDLHEEVEPEFVQLSEALSRTFSSLPRAPMLIDLQESLGWNRRQRITATISEMYRRYGLYGMTDSWRGLLLNWRLLLGAELMSAAHAKTETVAAALGYSSPEIFTRSFANAGMLSPGEVRRRLLVDPT